LTNKFGCRLTTIIGSFIAFLGFFLSCFVTKFFYLYLTIGVIVGFGFGLIYVPAIVSVGYYFDKKRSLAIGIAVCGSGLGTFILSPLNRILFESYGCQGAFLIKAALCLNLCVCGCLMRPVPVEPSEIYKRNKLNMKEQQQQQQQIKNNLSSASFDLSRPQILVSDEKNRIVLSQNGLNKSQPINLDKNLANLTRNHSARVPSPPTVIQSNDPAEFAKSMPMLLEKKNLTLDSLNLEAANNNEINNAILQLSKSTNSALDILAHVKSLQNIPLTCFDTNSLKEIERELKSNGEYIDCVDHSGKSKLKIIKEKLNETIDFSLFKSILFLFFVVSNFLTSLGFNVPYIYIVDQATLLKIKPELADLLLSTIGISNSIGRLILGFLGDLKGMNRIYLYSTVLSICGLATIIEPFCKNFISLFIYSIIFGLSSGIFSFL
jgi:MCP family monocarboxylic acid transporter-like MFS transporter 14